MNTFVMSDIHGCSKQLKEMLNIFSFNKEDEFIFLGDYIDRGPDSRGVLDILMLLEQHHKCVFLKGNHEKLLLDSLAGDEDMLDTFIYNGGMHTLNSFSDDPFHRNYEKKLKEIPEKYIKFIEQMKLFHETDTHFFVHAGVFPSNGIKERKEGNLLWIRDDFLHSKEDFGKIVIHGHTPEFEPVIKQNRIGIDTGCCFGGKLTCLCLPGNSFHFISNPKAKKSKVRNLI